mmetsp:Transcript_6942/g.12434  ORF Transcript_6942/g.12434 Transcript_6942/m.12434 type:complete len:172 (+) Transcript_6942:729-1244(+)
MGDFDQVTVKLDGILEIGIIRARWLSNKDKSLSKSDPYVIVKLGKTRLCQTQTIANEDCPEWNYHRTIQIHGRCLQSTVFTIEVWDEDHLTPDDFLGQLQFPLSVIMNQGIHGIYDLKQRKKNETVSGDITLDIQYSHQLQPKDPYQHILKINVDDHASSTPWFSENKSTQ